MGHTKYIISKLRFGRYNRFGPWEYVANSMNCDYSEIKNADKGITGRYFSIDMLAKELSTFPNIANAEFIPEQETSHTCRRVSLSNGGVLTQKGVVSDDELGQLGLLIFEYVPKSLI